MVDLQVDYDTKIKLDNIAIELATLTLAIQQLTEGLTEVKRVSELLNRNKDEAV